MSRVGKDHSIIPEFRISSLIEDYVETYQGDFLADLNNTLEITGASIPDSSNSDFFKTYTNSDFLKYFPVVDEAINDKRAGDLKIKRDKVSLKCSAFMKFLPYKGFYPAERALELASLFSQSYADGIYSSGEVGDPCTAVNTARQQVWRAMLEPLYAPGILFNTIKSGIAVSNTVLTNTASLARDARQNALNTSNGGDTVLPEGTLKWSKMIYPAVMESMLGLLNGYYIQNIPFETIYKPAEYLNSRYLTGSGAIFDTGIIDVTTTPPSLEDKFDSGVQGPEYVIFQDGKKLYEMAIDNFLCETTNFFTEKSTHFESKREDQFATVQKDQIYQMQLRLYRTLDNNRHVDTGSFNMYSRVSAFGYPLAGGASRTQARFVHVTPPYMSGSATATFSYTAQYTGRPTLAEILANTTIALNRDENPINVGRPASGSAMQVDSCFNLMDYYSEVPPGTTAQSNRWLIQAKFETPVLNFANVSYTRPATSITPAGITPVDDLDIRGMWHQYGALPTGSNEGIFAIIEPADGNFAIKSGSTDQLYGRATSEPSLADIIGMPTGEPLRIGEAKTSNRLEEAIIIAPYRVVKNRRKFFTFNRITKKTSAYKNLVPLMDKYVFPPKFDFTRHPSVKAIQMYAFEFGVDITRQDITDMWQNLPPEVSEMFDHKEVVIEDEKLIKSLIEKDANLRWMVFKVKKRAKMNFEKYRRSLITDNTTSFPETVGQYSYNWPYDYFSLVELLKIDEEVQYVSADLLDDPTPSTPKTRIVGDVNVNVANAPKQSALVVGVLDDDSASVVSGDVELPSSLSTSVVKKTKKGTTKR